MLDNNFHPIHTPISASTFSNHEHMIANRRRELNADTIESISSNELKIFKELSEELNELKEKISVNGNLTSTQIDKHMLENNGDHHRTSTFALNNKESNDLHELSSTTLSSSTTMLPQQPTTLSPSISSDQLFPFADLPYIALHNSIKQKELNKLLKEQELAEAYQNHLNNLYHHLIQESEQQYEEGSSHNIESNADTIIPKQSIIDTDEHRSTEKIHICLKCHYTCRRCKGKKLTQCIECHSDSQLDTTTGRCMLKQFSQTHLNKCESSGVWSNSMVSFDARVQNWITICSLVFCLFFSVAFFYLLLCGRERAFAHKHCQQDTENNFVPVQYCNQDRELASTIECEMPESCCLNSSSFEQTPSTGDLNLHKKSSSIFSYVFAISKFKRSHHNEKHTQVSDQLKSIKCINDKSIKFEARSTNGGIMELNEAASDDIT